METPDGKEFRAEQSAKAVAAAAEALASAGLLLLRAIGKILITTWRLAAALDSALWRATKLIAAKLLIGLSYALRLAAIALHSLLLWLPTRTGRAYSAISGVILVIGVLWIIDEIRSEPRLDRSGQSVLRPPLDQEDPILARIQGRYVHLSEIEAAARAGGFLREGEKLTPQSAFDRELVESYVEQRLLARAALEEGLQRAPQVLRRVNAARDRVLAAAYMEQRIGDSVTPQAVQQLYDAQKDITRLGDEVRARHILVETQEEADEIVQLLQGGADFGALARTRSLDRATAPLGGEIGWFTRSMMAPGFSKVAFSTRPGRLADPFATEFGWHIVEVLGRRSTQSVPLSAVEDEIEEFLRTRTIDYTLRELEEESQVVYFRPQIEERETFPPPPDLTAPVILESENSPDDATLR